MASDGQRKSWGSSDPLSAAHIYYGPDRDPRLNPRTRRLSTHVDRSRLELADGKRPPSRRASHDEVNHGRKFLIPVERTLRDLLQQEDSDQNEQITIDDVGPKVRVLRA